MEKWWLNFFAISGKRGLKNSKCETKNAGVLQKSYRLCPLEMSSIRNRYLCTKLRGCAGEDVPQSANRHKSKIKVLLVS